MIVPFSVSIGMGDEPLVAGCRKHGVVPVLALVPAVASLYLAAGCTVPISPESTATSKSTPPAPTRNLVQSPTARPTPTTTTTTTTIPPTAQADPVDYAAVCADAVTGKRLDDDECADADESFSGDDRAALEYAAAGLAGGAAGTAMWYYLSVRNRITAPAVGQFVSNGTYATPLRNSVGGIPIIYRYGSVDTTGGPLTPTGVLRGGLGFHSSGAHS
ncbi:hypothetical protein ACWDSJ_26645 [Nocardia sp. NPDC003482]